MQKGYMCCSVPLFGIENDNNLGDENRRWSSSCRFSSNGKFGYITPFDPKKFNIDSYKYKYIGIPVIQSLKAVCDH